MRQWRGLEGESRPFTPKGSVPNWIKENLYSDTTDCIFWPFYKPEKNYPSFWKDGKTLHLNHFLCEERNGPRPDGQLVRHLCGNGVQGCVNPLHLAWGTYKDNYEDAVSHGTNPRGERHGNHKLKEDQVIEIFKRAKSGFETYKQIAQDYGVSSSTVQYIGNSKLWRWLTKDIEIETAD